jgi:hypothetical protein
MKLCAMCPNNVLELIPLEKTSEQPSSSQLGIISQPNGSANQFDFALETREQVVSSTRGNISPDFGRATHGLRIWKLLISYHKPNQNILAKPECDCNMISATGSPALPPSH